MLNRATQYARQYFFSQQSTSAPAQLPDICQIMNLQSYDPKNDLHKKLIEQELALFNENLAQLIDLSEKGALGMAGMTFVLLLAEKLLTDMTLPVIIGALLVSCGGTYLVASTYAPFATHAKEVQKRLDTMLAIYHWCANKRNLYITHDPLFLMVLEAIVPFVKLDQLMLTQLQQAVGSQLSPRFIELLGEAPHQLHIAVVETGRLALVTAKDDWRDWQSWERLFGRATVSVARHIHPVPEEVPTSTHTLR